LLVWLKLKNGLTDLAHLADLFFVVFVIFRKKKNLEKLTGKVRNRDEFEIVKVAPENILLPYHKLVSQTTTGWMPII